MRKFLAATAFAVLMACSPTPQAPAGGAAEAPAAAPTPVDIPAGAYTRA